ncbi:MAG TPA: hypothetical protein VJ103_01440 [Candidatus Paceibacterota bacterium]|nr:hypothetical protein [Candidatus Paceibacterota bacterium]
MENIESKEKSLPIKSLVISLVVLILIVAGLSGGSGISRPGLQLAIVGQSTLPSCPVGSGSLTFRLTALSAPVDVVRVYQINLAEGTNFYIYNFDVVAGTITVIQTPGVFPITVSGTSVPFTFAGCFPADTYTLTVTPVNLADALLLQYATRLTILVAAPFITADTSSTTTPPLAAPIPSGVSDSIIPPDQLQGSGVDSTGGGSGVGI